MRDISEIKFRARYKITEKGFVYFNLEDLLNREGPAFPEDMIGEIMAFTGMKDRNGKEIYESDIVQHRRLTRPGDDMNYGIAFQMQGNIKKVEFESYGFAPFAGWIDNANKDLEWEIIGNVWENPKLIK